MKHKKLVDGKQYLLKINDKNSIQHNGWVVGIYHEENKAFNLNPPIHLKEVSKCLDIEGVDKLINSEDSIEGLWFTKKEPRNLFNEAMSFKSDSNPFTVDGECEVKDGYSHCEKSVLEYFDSIFFQC